jgi:hypothetical protein
MTSVGHAGIGPLPVADPVSALAQALFVAALFARGYFLLQRRDAGGK